MLIFNYNFISGGPDYLDPASLVDSGFYLNFVLGSVLINGVNFYQFNQYIAWELDAIDVPTVNGMVSEGVSGS